jgi:Membrane protein implicated in regulation of membrane protease activity
MVWWLWLLFGFLLLLAELLTPGGFYLFFFGVGALLVGLITAYCSLTPSLQLLFFAALSLTSLAVFRRRLVASRARASAVIDSLIGETAIALDDIAVNGFGKAELRGTAWSAHNVGTTPILKSQRCKVESVEGLTLYIRN